MTPKMHPFWWFKKPAITCPEGEQITNGGFETGLLSPWQTNTPSVTQVVTYSPHSGSYCLRLGVGSDVWQDLTILVDCIQSFRLWGKLVQEVEEPDLIIIVNYTDGDRTEVHLTGATDWVEVDILPHLTSGKTIESIWCYYQVINGYAYVDDVSLMSGV